MVYKWSINGLLSKSLILLQPFLYSGQILNTTTNPLTWDDIFYICNQLDYTNEFYKEIVWLEEVLTLIMNNVFYNKYRTRVTRQLASAYFKVCCLSVQLTLSINTGPGLVKWKEWSQYEAVVLNKLF
jgi:hypothetical protein